MMPPCSWSNSWQEARHVDERQQWNVERVARADESRGLVGRVDVERSGQHRRLVRHDADAASADVREADDDVRRPGRLDLEEVAVVDDTTDDVVHVVRLSRFGRNDRVKRHVAAIVGI